MNTILCNATLAVTNSGKDMMDADKTTIAIDSWCSYSIVKRKEDFIGPMKNCNMTIQGFSGKSRVTKMGTWRFTLED